MLRGESVGYSLACSVCAACARKEERSVQAQIVSLWKFIMVCLGFLPRPRFSSPLAPPQRACKQYLLDPRSQVAMVLECHLAVCSHI